MKKLMIALACLVVLTGCGPSQSQSQVYVNPAPVAVVTPSSSTLGDNLNLQALGELVRRSANAQAIEGELNKPNSINNLDLDGDGQVDYIKVTEYANGNTKGFSFTVELAGGQTQEVATVELQQGQGNQATMNIQGNQTVRHQVRLRYGHLNNNL